jgi:hypothetical protein
MNAFACSRGTLFAFHKLPLRGYLAAIAIFCNEVKGKSALAISRDLGLSYKAAFVLLHKLREANSLPAGVISPIGAIDFGLHLRQCVRWVAGKDAQQLPACGNADLVSIGV